MSASTSSSDSPVPAATCSGVNFMARKFLAVAI